MKQLSLNFGISRIGNDSSFSSEENLQHILGDTLLRNDNLFIIGSEAIFEKETPGTQGTGDSLILLFNAIADSIREPLENRPQNESEWHRWFKLKKLDRTICETAWNCKISDMDLSRHVSQELISFLENGIKYYLIHIVFTTCIDPTLEVVMNQICEENKRSLRVFNFKGDNQISKYITEAGSEDIILVYLWGKIGDTEPTLGRDAIDYVFTEDDAMVTIADYIKKANDNTVDLFRKVFFNNRIMAIGCNFEDWKFRFFWYSIRGDLKRISNGTVSYSCIDTDHDSLFQYLKSTNGLHVDNNSRSFLNKLSDVMKGEALFEKIKELKAQSSPGLFISYASEDVLTASNLFYYFVNKCHLGSWIDTQALTVTDKYNEKIHDAIRDCRVFVPLLTTQVMHDIINGNIERYYFKEWKAAYKNGKTIVPISVGEYDFRGDYHKYFREVCGFEGNDDITVLPLTQIEKITNKLREFLF